MVKTLDHVTTIVKSFDETTAALKPNLNVSFGVSGLTPLTPSSLNLDFWKNGASYDAARVFALEPHYVRPSEAEVKFPNGLGPGTGFGVR